jgi:hypothetical protein
MSLTKEQYLKHTEEVYKKVGEAVTTVGLFLTPPFAGNAKTGELAEEIRDGLVEIEGKVRDLYQAENRIERA